MRIHTLLITLAAASVSVSAVAAPPTITPDAGSSAMVSVQTIQGASHKLRAGDVDALPGSYTLPNGQVLRVSFEQRKLFAEVGDSKSEIVPAGPNTFVSRDEGMKLVFDQMPFATDVALTRK